MFLQKDESLYSFLFRVAEVYGLEPELSCLLGANGYWLGSPRWPESYCYLLSSVPDLELISLIYRSGLGKPLGLFESPQYLRFPIVDIFGSKPPDSIVYRKGKHSIRYCEFCIEDSVIKNGFGYLKAHWINAFQCSIHEADLCVLPESTRKKNSGVSKVITKRAECA